MCDTEPSNRKLALSLGGIKLPNRVVWRVPPEAGALFPGSITENQEKRKIETSYTCMQPYFPIALNRLKLPSLTICNIHTNWITKDGIFFRSRHLIANQRLQYRWRLSLLLLFCSSANEWGKRRCVQKRSGNIWGDPKEIVRVTLSVRHTPCRGDTTTCAAIHVCMCTVCARVCVCMCTVCVCLYVCVCVCVYVCMCTVCVCVCVRVTIKRKCHTNS